MPLIHYKPSSVELQYHLMKIVVDYTKYLNSGQVTAGVSYLPLYALKRSIQMAYPEEFEGYFCFMGVLHIEQAALVCIGQLKKGSGLDDIVDAASLDTVGLKTAVCDVNNIKKARYTLQVVAQLSQKNQWCFQNQYFWNYETLDWESKGKSNVWLLVQCSSEHQNSIFDYQIS